MIKAILKLIKVVLTLRVLIGFDYLIFLSWGLIRLSCFWLLFNTYLLLTPYSKIDK
jgi:hypothetical protein